MSAVGTGYPAWTLTPRTPVAEWTPKSTHRTLIMGAAPVLSMTKRLEGVILALPEAQHLPGHQDKHLWKKTRRLMNYSVSYTSIYNSSPESTIWHAPARGIGDGPRLCLPKKQIYFGHNRAARPCPPADTQPHRRTPNRRTRHRVAFLFMEGRLSYSATIPCPHRLLAAAIPLLTLQDSNQPLP